MKIDIIEELTSTGLWRYLHDINPDYAKKVIKFVEGINPILNTICKIFPFYTRHDAIHGLNVVKRIQQIIFPECLQKDSEISFTKDEAYLLLTSAFSHDLGMTVFPGEERKLLSFLDIDENSKWQTNKKLQKYIRINHSKRGLDYIIENKKELDIPQNLIDALGKLMESHNMTIHQLEMNLGKRFSAGEKEINLLQLACILCIADALEYSDTRVIDGVLEKLKNPKNNDELISYRENLKHICIRDSLAIGNDGKVIFSGTFEDPDVLELAHKTIDNIESWVQQYCDIDYKSSNKRIKIRSDSFIRNFGIPGVDFIRLGIRIKKDNIINLISSKSIWTENISIPIREILQNSVEACRYREANTPKIKKYSPKININIDTDNRKMEFIDNGCGMGKNIILNHFLNIGNSRAFSPTYAFDGYYPLSRFGIGFWSLSTIANKVEIKTAPFELLENFQNLNDKVDGYQFKIELNSFKDYTVFYRIEKEVGTTILAELKDNINIEYLYELCKDIMISSEICFCQ